METPLSTTDPNRLRQRIVDLGEQWADANAAADLLEEGRKSVLAELSLKAQGKSMAEREAMALAGSDYRSHLGIMVEARRKANRAMVNYKAALSWIELVRSVEATKRQEMGLR